MSLDSFKTKKNLTFRGQNYSYFSLPALAENLKISLDHLPFSHRVLLENLLRNEDGVVVKKEDIEFLANRQPNNSDEKEIQFQPARVLLQDFTGVPVIADLAALRDSVVAKGHSWEKVNPLQQVDLVIDHSVQVDVFGKKNALEENTRLEFERNQERYRFLKWGQKNFKNLRIVPPATGICHQVNIEYIAQGVWTQKVKNEKYFCPDSCIGTDSHTPMVNSLGVLGWGVGGIEAEAAMLGQPISLLVPPVIGFELKGKLPAGITSTDLVLYVTQILRKKGVVGKFVEFFGEGLSSLAAADRATVSNMAPEYGATIGIFPPDEKTLIYFRATGRETQADLIQTYYRVQNMWGISNKKQYQDVVSLDLESLRSTLAGPSKPHERVGLSDVSKSFRQLVMSRKQHLFKDIPTEKTQTWAQEGGSLPEVDMHLKHHGVERAEEDPFFIKTGDVVIAAITSCTNTSNQRLMIAAGLVAKKAAELGLKTKPWVKTSFAPGSRVVSEYMKESKLLPELEKLGFNLVGFGCTTCIGNSGPLPEDITGLIQEHEIATAAVLSGNRNFEARIHPLVIGNYLASPPLVVAYALAGTVLVDLSKDELGKSKDGTPILLKDLWPSEEQISEFENSFIRKEIYEKNYAHVLDGDENWKKLPSGESNLFPWEKDSTYLQKPPFLEEPWVQPPPKKIENGQILAIFGDFITTDHISPAGSISPKSPAGIFLQGKGIQPGDFNSYGSRRGNHHVMIRGTFANVRIKNKLVDREGGYTILFPEKKETTIYEASEQYLRRGTPLVVFAGQEYGSGSSRDWAAKGTRLLGVRAVIAEGFERIHRSNLIGMGVLPLQMTKAKIEELNLTGEEKITIEGLDQLKARMAIKVTVDRGGQKSEIATICRIDTENELAYYQAGGLLPFMNDKIIKGKD